MNDTNENASGNRPRTDAIVISTWKHGLPANRVAGELLARGAPVLDAVTAGVAVSEADPAVTSVGRGGFPNRDGVMQLDAAVVRGADLEAGAVAGMQAILHPVQVARLVLLETPHVMLVGDGARQFALAHGHVEEELLTDEARAAWQRWRASGKKEPISPHDDHDTIGLVALDGGGQMAAACTTSGMSWKLPGRVGDSPLIGHGLYCDDQAGGAAATGVGEEVTKICGSYQVVEFMRQGMEPQQAVERVLDRAIARNEKNRDQMIGFVALRNDGEVGFACTTEGFQAAITHGPTTRLVDAPRYLGASR